MWRKLCLLGVIAALALMPVAILDRDKESLSVDVSLQQASAARKGDAGSTDDGSLRGSTDDRSLRGDDDSESLDDPRLNPSRLISRSGQIVGTIKCELDDPLPDPTSVELPACRSLR